MLLVISAAAILLGACGTATKTTTKKPASATKTAKVAQPSSPLGPTLGYAKTAKLKPGPYLAPGSNPGAIPSDVLIADRNNNRLIIVNPQGNIVWQFPQPGNLAPGQTFVAPDDAFFTPNGRDIIVTQESNYTITEVSIAKHRIVWRYGHPGVPGSAPNYLDNPDDAMMLPNGDILAADIINCRLLILRPPSHVPVQVIGETTQACYHQPPTRWGSPNGAFPMTNGRYVVTEINGDWADQLNLANDHIGFMTNPPGVLYPSDTNQVGNNTNLFLTADYSNPGQVEEFTSSGQLVWRYRPTGALALNKPSLALPLPNGDVIMTDDWNHRIIVVNPKTNQIVWQYGHKGIPGSAPGYLNKPDGLDLAPPYSLTMTHAKTMGLPSPSLTGAASSTSSTTTAG